PRLPGTTQRRSGSPHHVGATPFAARGHWPTREAALPGSDRKPSGGLADGGAYPVVLAARVEASEEPRPRAVPTFTRVVGRPSNDRITQHLIIATDQRDGGIRASLSENRVSRLLICSHLRSPLAGLMDTALGTL